MSGKDELRQRLQVVAGAMLSHQTELEALNRLALLHEPIACRAISFAHSHAADLRNWAIHAAGQVTP